MPRDSKLYNGFMLHDYLLTFAIASEKGRASLVELCRGPWQGDEVTPGTWEISNDLSPDEMEEAITKHLGDGDRAAYYYLSDASRFSSLGGGKRIYRIVLQPMSNEG